MQLGAWNRSIWAGCALLAALNAASVEAAPLSRTDSTTDAAADDNNDSGTDTLNSALPANASAANVGGPGKPAPAALTVPDHDLGRSVREITKPLLEELTHSDVADAVRALDAKPNTADAGLENAGDDGNGRDPAMRRRNWDGTGQKQAEENTPTANGPRDPERDKVRASVLLSGLINEIKPWAAGAAVLYILGYIAKFTLAARRRSVQRRMERRKQKARGSRHGRL